MDDQPTGRLSKAQRRQQLLQTARLIVREEGVDRLTLAHLAVRAGVSKPITYDHFETRNGLLIALYRWIDTERVGAFRTLMAQGNRSAHETIAALAHAYLACGLDQGDEFNSVGAALGGSEEKAAVYQDLVDGVIAMFVDVLRPHSTLPVESLALASRALVGAGDALTACVMGGQCSVVEGEAMFANLIGVAVKVR